MTFYKPRYYQTEALKCAKEYMRNNGKSGLAVLPTGTGKSHIIADLIQQLFTFNNKHKILMVTHVKELIEQNFDKLKLHWETPSGRPPAGINSAGIGSRHFTQPIIYAGIQSIYKDASKFGKVTVLMIDECHLLSDKSTGMYKTFIQGLKSQNPELRIFGFTATPFRMDMGHLCKGDTFNDVFYNISYGDDFTKLIKEGYLSHLKGIQPEQELDLSKVEMTKNEFKEGSLDHFVNRSEITKKIVTETIQWASGRKKGLAFCVSKSHAEDMSSRFNQAGLKATFIHSELSAELRAQRLADYKKGNYTLITNVGVLTTGFDAPDIDYILMARPTRSPSLHIQMLGRGMRPHPDKRDCLVLDYGGNIKRLGFVNDVSLPQKNTSGSDVAKVKSCKKCSAFIALSAKKCSFCGAEVQSKPKQVTPDKNVHRGKVISSEPVNITKQNTLKHTKVKNHTPRLSIELKFNNIKTAIFNITKDTDPTEIEALILVNYEGPGPFLKRKQRNRWLHPKDFATILTQTKYRNIKDLNTFLDKTLKSTHFQIFKRDDESLRAVWPKLTNLSGFKLIDLLKDYSGYLKSIKKENEQTAIKSKTSHDRFIKYVFSYPQVDCPFDKKKTGCLFVETKVKKILCKSCGKIKSYELVLQQFEKLHLSKEVKSQSRFIKDRLLGA